MLWIEEASVMNEHKDKAGELTRDEARGIAQQARQAFEEWRRTSFPPSGRAHEKGRSGAAAPAGGVRRDHDGEMGKTRKEALAEIEKCAFNCDHTTENAERYLARELVDLGGPKLS